jgi:hypothetical protein
VGFVAGAALLVAAGSASTDVSGGVFAVFVFAWLSDFGGAVPAATVAGDFFVVSAVSGFCAATRARVSRTRWSLRWARESFLLTIRR